MSKNKKEIQEYDLYNTVFGVDKEGKLNIFICKDGINIDNINDLTPKDREIIKQMVLQCNTTLIKIFDQIDEDPMQDEEIKKKYVS